MKIAASMDLQQLIELMGQAISFGPSSRPSLAEAATMREYLMRDFPQQDTENIDKGRWRTLCCVVEHEHWAVEA